MALIVSAIPAVVSAEDSAPVDGSNEELDVPTVIPDSEDTENKTRVQIYNEQGFNFPEEGDLTVPKFKLVYEDGTEEIFYDTAMMSRSAKTAPSGTTLVLLSDLYQSVDYVNKVYNETGLHPLMSFTFDDQRTLGFDFAGHTIFSEYKQAFFQSDKLGTLNIYSSLPGAKLICLEQGTTKGGSIANSNGGSTVTIGKFGDYPGSNLSTYSAGGVGTGSSSTLIVEGISMYRVATDYVSFFSFSGSGSTHLYKDARLFGVGRYLQFACREDGTGRAGSVHGNVGTFENCVISNIGSPGVVAGSFFRYMADDNELHFKKTIFDQVSFNCDKYYEHESVTDFDGTPLLPNKTARITLDKDCTYNQVPDVLGIYGLAPSSSKYAMFEFPELTPLYGMSESVPEFIMANGLVNNVYTFITDEAFITENGYRNIVFEDLTANGEDISGMFALPYLGYEEDVVEVTWSFQGASYNEQELWVKGYQPVPYRLDIPEDNDYIKYVIEQVYEDEESALYSISPEVDLTFKINYTFANQLLINVYIPMLEDFPLERIVNRITIAGTTKKLADIRNEKDNVVEIGGASYYKVSAPVEFSRVTDFFYVNVDIPSGTASTFSVSKKIELAKELVALLDSEDAQLKANMEEALVYIVKNTAVAGAITGISKVVNERFADKLVKEEPKEEPKEESFFDKLFK